MNRPGPYLLTRILASAMFMATPFTIAVPIHAQPSIVEVMDSFSLPVEDARVVFKAPDGRELAATYEREHRWYRFTEALVLAGGPGPVDLGAIHVTHPTLERQIVPVKMGPDASPLRIYLGKPGSEYTYISGRRIPYTPDYNVYGVIATRIDSNRLRSMIDTLDLSVSIGDGMYVLRSETPFPRMRDERLFMLRSLFGGSSVGPIIGSNTLLTNRILVQFVPNARHDDCVRILREEGIPDCEQIMSQLYAATANSSLSHGINDLMDRLARRPEIESVLGSAVRSSLPLDSHSR